MLDNHRPFTHFKRFFSLQNFEIKLFSEAELLVEGSLKLPIQFIQSTEENFANCIFANSCSASFLTEWIAVTGWNASENYESEEAIFEAKNIPFIPVFQREQAAIIQQAIQKKSNQSFKFLT